MNWSYLGTALPQGPEIIDFYDACDHLRRAFDAAYGENSSRSKAQFEKYRHLLRDEEEGVEKVIRALCHLRDTHPRKKKLSTELAYFPRQLTVTACAMHKRKRRTSPLVQGSSKPRARRSRPKE